MVMVHNEFLPIIRLHRVFEIEDAVTDPLRGLLIVVADGDSRSAILVDHVLGQQQVVAKSLGTRFRVPGVSGAAILGTAVWVSLSTFVNWLYWAGKPFRLRGPVKERRHGFKIERHTRNRTDRGEICTFFSRARNTASR